DSPNEEAQTGSAAAERAPINRRSRCFKGRAATTRERGGGTSLRLAARQVWKTCHTQDDRRAPAGQARQQPPLQGNGEDCQDDPQAVVDELGVYPRVVSGQDTAGDRERGRR